MTQQDKLEQLLTLMANKGLELYKKYWPDKQPIKAYTHRRWGNRYAKGWRFSHLVTHKEAKILNWQDYTVQTQDDFIRACQTMEQLGYEFTNNIWSVKEEA